MALGEYSGLEFPLLNKHKWKDELNTKYHKRDENMYNVNNLTIAEVNEAVIRAKNDAFNWLKITDMAKDLEEEMSRLNMVPLESNVDDNYNNDSNIEYNLDFDDIYCSNDIIDANDVQIGESNISTEEFEIISFIPDDVTEAREHFGRIDMKAQEDYSEEFIREIDTQDKIIEETESSISAADKNKSTENLIRGAKEAALESSAFIFPRKKQKLSKASELRLTDNPLQQVFEFKNTKGELERRQFLKTSEYVEVPTNGKFVIVKKQNYLKSILGGRKVLQNLIKDYS